MIELEKTIIDCINKLDDQIKNNIYNEEYNKKEYDYIDVLTYQKITLDLLLNKLNKLNNYKENDYNIGYTRGKTIGRGYAINKIEEKLKEIENNGTFDAEIVLKNLLNELK